MSSAGLDDEGLRTAMRAFLSAAASLDDASATGAEPRQLLDLAEAKTLAGMQLRRCLTELGWSAPVPERSSL